MLVFSTLFSYNPVSANGQENVNEEELQQEIEKGKQLSQYADVNQNGVISFDHERALEDGLNPELVEETKNIYDTANEQAINNEITTFNANCNGVSTAESGSFTATIYLNSCDTSTLIGVMQASGGAAQATALIPVLGTIPGTALNAMLQSGAALIQINDNGAGVAISAAKNNLPGSGPTGYVPYWISGQ